MHCLHKKKCSIASLILIKVLICGLNDVETCAQKFLLAKCYLLFLCLLHKLTLCTSLRKFRIKIAICVNITADENFSEAALLMFERGSFLSGNKVNWISHSHI